MENWRKTSVLEPQAVGKHKRREHEMERLSKSCKFLKPMSAPPAQRPNFRSDSANPQPREEGDHRRKEISAPPREGCLSVGVHKRREREREMEHFPKSSKFLKPMSASPTQRASFKPMSASANAQPREGVDRRLRKEISAPPREGTKVKRSDHNQRSMLKTVGEPKRRQNRNESRHIHITRERMSASPTQRAQPREGVDRRLRKEISAPPREGIKTSGVDQRSMLKKVEQNEWLQERRMVMQKLKRYRSHCQSLEEESKEKKKSRVDYKAYQLLKKDFPNLSIKPLAGTVPGIEVGEKFRFRMELYFTGLHRHTQAGIHTTEHEHGGRIAISVVDSGEYENYMRDPETLIYCAQGSSIEQKTNVVNQALIRSIKVKNPVRVIRSMKVRGYKTYIYDGLYTVEGTREERKVDGNTLKFKLVRRPGQPSSLLNKNSSSLKYLKS